MKIKNKFLLVKYCKRLRILRIRYQNIIEYFFVLYNNNDNLFKSKLSKYNEFRQS
jgi:hypothetical protein